MIRDFHRESQSEDVKVKVLPGMEVSAKKRLSQTRHHLNYSNCQGYGRGSGETKIKEEDYPGGHKEKPICPPSFPSGTTADLTVQSATL